MAEQSVNEERIRKITSLYYSRKDIQDAIFNFSVNREVVPRFFEGFGKRPDSLQYTSDIFEMVKKGATSFHVSQEIWKDPLQISTGMNEAQLNSLRTSWDLLIDIDSKYLDYSRIMAELIIKVLNFHKVKNIGIKFSGSKGFHILIPSKAFPKKIGECLTKDMFPEWPRIVTKYIFSMIEKDLITRISELERPNKYIKDFQASKEVVPDLVLVSSRHLFRAPYSLHEKTSLASVVFPPEKIKEFDFRSADPMKVKIMDFLPKVKDGEASELLISALDWSKEKNPAKKEPREELAFKPIKMEKLSESHFPPSVRKILQGVGDGRKRSLFVLINFFRSIGIEKDELETRIESWNKKNQVPLKEGYIKAQLDWSFRNKIVLPPNFDKDYYKGIGISPSEEEIRLKNPVNYVKKKYFSSAGKKESSK